MLNSTIPSLTIGLRATFIFILAAAAGSLLKGDEVSGGAGENPLLTPSKLQFGYPSFDKVRSENIAPAYEAGMLEEDKEVDAIASNPDKPTFENTIVAMEREGRLLERVERFVSIQSSCNTNPEIQKIESRLSPKLSAHRDSILLNTALFARIQALYEQREALGLDPESKRLLWRYYTDFVRAGARLSEPDKTKLRQMNSELASLQIKFNQNLQNESNASAVVLDNRDDLKGMSESEIAATAAAAKADKHEGKYEIRIFNTSGQPAESSLENRALRERLQTTSEGRNSRGGEFDNREVVIRIAKLRAERAALLGYPSHAAYVLEDQTAKNVENVNKILHDLAVPAAANARKEAAEIQGIIDKDGGGFKLASWDWSFYSEKVRQSKYAFDESQIRPYFEIDHVRGDGVFYAAEKLYGITFKERKDLPVYQPDVRVFEVFDSDGKSLALFIADYYARPSKRGGAWSSSYVSQSTLRGTHVVVANHLNIPKPPAGEPTLLTYEEVRTLFHEFGHALHSMFSNVTYLRFSGTSVPRDFVEFPSQVNEMWRPWPEVLSHYAKHYKTGEALPTALLDKIVAASKFDQGFRTSELLAAMIIDQAWYQLPADKIPTDIPAFEHETLRKAGLDLDVVPPRYHSTYFQHVFQGGYSAGYYSYIWAEVLDADSVEWIKQHGGLKRENGDRFRSTLLSRGGSEDAMVLFKNFTGRDPYIEPLLERRGLNSNTH